MRPKYKSITIVLDHTLSEADIKDLERWEDDGGASDSNNDIYSLVSSAIPVKKKQIFEVVDSNVVIENGQLYLKADINILSLH